MLLLSSPLFSYLLLLLLVSSPLSRAAQPKALFAPISFDSASSQYILTLQEEHNKSFVLDLSNSLLWETCKTSSSSSSFLPVACRTAICNSAIVCNSAICSAAPSCLTECLEPPSPTCLNNSCSVFISNTAIFTSMSGQLWTDTIQVDSTDGKNPGSPVEIKKFAFACGPESLLEVNNTVPMGVVGVAGLSRAKLALPSQLAAKKSLKRKFAYCLPSGGSTGTGVVFFGDSPYVFLPGIDVSQSLRFTPLIRNKDEPDEYFIGVKSISVNLEKLPIDSNLFRISKDNTGGTRISSVARYTQLKPSIYKALRDAFIKAAEARGIRQVASVQPFDACFNASTAFVTRVGYNVPQIDLALQGSGGVVWSILGANSVVSVNDDVFCLAFQNTREFESRAIVIGTFQQENALLQFDLATSRLGFLTTLLGFRTTCANFNFTLSP